MGEVQKPKPVLLVAAISSRHVDAIDWAVERAASDWGDAVLRSELFAFTETRYYEPTMGPDLKKQLIAFSIVDPAILADAKVQSNGWEMEYRDSHDWPEPRPLNIDPGYVTEAKLVLATTKDRDHRIYLREGIYAEVTLHFHHGEWQSSRWTYPDYQRDDYHRFLTSCRNHLRTAR